MFHKVKSVKPLKKYILEVIFKTIQKNIMILANFSQNGLYLKTFKLI